MPKERKIVSTLISAAVFIIMEIAALSMLSNSSTVQNLWLSKMSHRFMAKAWGGSENIRYYFSLKEQNEALAEENHYLQLALKQYQQSADSAKIERRMQQEQEFVGDFRFIHASIVKMSRNSQHNYIIIDKGYEDGVHPQSGIITSEGVVGIIDAVDKHYSYALSFMNSGLSVSSRIGREGAVGPLSWDGRNSDGAVLKEIPLQNKFAPGDTIWTSGYSSIFPADIPVGVIEKSHIVNGAVNECHIKLFQDFSALRYVTVVENNSRSEIHNLESVSSNSAEKK